MHLCLDDSYPCKCGPDRGNPHSGLLQTFTATLAAFYSIETLQLQSDTGTNYVLGYHAACEALLCTPNISQLRLSAPIAHAVHLIKENSWIVNMQATCNMLQSLTLLASLSLAMLLTSAAGCSPVVDALSGCLVVLTSLSHLDLGACTAHHSTEEIRQLPPGLFRDNLATLHPDLHSTAWWALSPATRSPSVPESGECIEGIVTPPVSGLRCVVSSISALTQTRSLTLPLWTLQVQHICLADLVMHLRRGP